MNLLKEDLKKNCEGLAMHALNKKNNCTECYDLANSMLVVFFLDRYIEKRSAIPGENNFASLDFLEKYNPNKKSREVLRKEKQRLINNMLKEENIDNSYNLESYLKIKAITIGMYFIDIALSIILKNHEKTESDNDWKFNISKEMRKINDYYSKTEEVTCFSLKKGLCKENFSVEKSFLRIKTAINESQRDKEYKSIILRLVKGIISGYKKNELGAI